MSAERGEAELLAALPSSSVDVARPPSLLSFRLLSAGIAAAGTEKEGGRQKSGKQPNNLDSFQPSFPVFFVCRTYVRSRALHLFCEREVRRRSEILPLLSRLLSLRVHHPAEAESDGMPQKKKGEIKVPGRHVSPGKKEDTFNPSKMISSATFLLPHN